MRLPKMCVVLLLMALLGLGGCVSGPFRITSVGPNIRPLLMPHRPLTTVVACGDTNARYPHQLYEAGNRLMAHMLDAAVEPNADELTAYVVELNSHLYDPASTPLVIRIPAVAADPLPPSLTPTPTPSGNPYSDAQARDRDARANAAVLQSYQQLLAQHHATLDRVRYTVKQQTDALRQLNPPRDPASSSVLSCLSLASDRFAGVGGDKWLLMWSDLQHTSWQDDLPPSRLSLRGVHIRVLFVPCNTATQCYCSKAFWRRIFQAAGASAGDIAFYDPAESTTLDPFFTVHAATGTGVTGD